MSGVAEPDISPNIIPNIIIVENRLFIRVFQAIVVLVILSAIINLAGRYFGSTIAMGGHTDQTAPYKITIRNQALSIPANMMRFYQQRHNGPAQRIDLYLKWPNLTGYSEEDRNIFNLMTPERQLLFVSIEEKTMSRDMSARYLPIYAHMLEPQGDPAPAGLKLHRFQDNNAYRNERLALSSTLTGQPEFVARCLDDLDAQIPLSLCERDIHFGDGLQLQYRFPISMLGEWRALDKAMQTFATSRL